MRIKSVLMFGVLVAICLLPAPAFAQVATITGTITDERGEFRLLNLPPGKYKVSAELSGFSSVILPSVELLVGQNATIPFVLKVANLSETVTVSSEAPLVDTTSSQVAGNVN